MKLLLKNGHLIDPANKLDEKLDLLIEDKKIKKIGKNISANQAKIIDVRNKIVCPGLIDIHTHLRQPGREDEETIFTGTRSAAKGGFTTICCMPNTSPEIDSVSGVRFVSTTAQREGAVNVYIIGCMTKRRKGEELADIGKMYEAGIVGLSDDGNSVMNSQIMRRVMEYAKMFKLPVISHCEDINLSNNGQINEGNIALKLGLRGIPAQAEEIMVMRDISLAELTGVHLHIAHISTQGSVKMIREAKKRKIKVTAEVAPHHFSLTQEDITNYDTNFKVNPPLRTKDDVKEIFKGLKDKTIDCIASDHAPHTLMEKEKEFNSAPFGMVGLETTVPLVFTKLVFGGVLTLFEAIEKLTINPARILSLNKGTLSLGEPADVSVIDPEMEQLITAEWFVSKSKNSPFIGKKLKGFAVLTIVDGNIVMENQKPCI